MRRLILAAILGLAPLATSFSTEAQQGGKTFRIGFLNVGAASRPVSSGVKALLEALRERGYVEGQNLALEWRGADWAPERLPVLAAELVRLRVDHAPEWDEWRLVGQLFLCAGPRPPREDRPS